MRQRLRKNLARCNGLLQGHTTPYLHPCEWQAQEIGFGVDVYDMHIISFAARFRVATPGTFADGLGKIQVARNNRLVTLHAFSTVREK